MSNFSPEYTKLRKTMNWETLLCLGDSITIGARSYAGYPEYAASQLSSQLGKDFNVLNCAVSGNTAIDLLRHLDEKMPVILSQKPDIVSLLIGTNDIKNNTSPENYRMALRLILLKCRLIAGCNHIVLLHIPPLANGMKYPYHAGMNRLIDSFNLIIEEEARRLGIRTLAFILSEGDYFDGVHFNENGSRNAGKQLAALILKDKGVCIETRQEMAQNGTRPTVLANAS